MSIDLEDAYLADIDLSYFDLSRANLMDANLSLSKLHYANMRYANMQRANLNSITINDADLSYANLRDASFCWANLAHTNLSSVNLCEAHLVGSFLSEIKLIKADLSDTNLRGANFFRSNLSNASLVRAYLINAKLYESNLSNADLTDADLRDAILNATNLENARFFNAAFGMTTFADVDLSQVKGLKSFRHKGPSTIGIDTLYKSGGNIPVEFLEGCGVPESMITFAKSLVGQTIEYYSCFISYSSKDQEFCDQLYQRMKTENLRVWYAPEDMKGGERIYTQIDEAIGLFDKLIIVLSEASLNSNWVRVEIQRALKRERTEGRRVLFPIMLVDYGVLRNWELVTSDGTDLAEEIREYFIPDFSGWKDYDQFTAAFKRLVDDLRKSE